MENSAAHWIKRRSETNGSHYYYNLKTGVSQWEPPPELVPAATPMIYCKTPSAKPREWVQKISRTTGVPYFFNIRTGKSSWNRSTSLPVGKLESIIDEDGEEVEEVEEASETEKPENEGVEEASETEKPENEGVEGVESEGDTENSDEDGEDTDEEREKKKVDVWEPRVSRNTGKTYYVNVLTKKTQWEKPNAE